MWRGMVALAAVAVMTASLPAPGPTAATSLNTLWNTYGNQGGHWTGGDRTTSVPLPDGRTAWLFSDTFLGTVNPDHSRPAGSPLPRNTLVVQEPDGRLGATLHGGTVDRPRALVEVPGSVEHLWVADGTVENGALKVLYNRYESTGSGALDLKGAGTSLATFSLPELTLTELIPVPVSKDIAWGSEILHDGGHTYIYGAEHNPSSGKYLRLARAGSLNGAWEFWTGTGWSTTEAHSVRMLAGVGTAFSVIKVGNEFVLVTVDSNVAFNPTLVAYTSTTPTGPFGNPYTLYRAPEGEPPIIVYDATVHPHVSQNGTLVVSYNVNSLNVADNLADARIYRPRFIDVTWPASRIRRFDKPAIS